MGRRRWIARLIGMRLTANINVQDSAGNRVLHMAVQKGYQRTVAFLLQRGARTDIMNHNGQTATTLAEFSQNEDIISIFIKRAEQRNGMEVSRTLGKNDLMLVADEPQPSTSRGEDAVAQEVSSTVEGDSTGITMDRARKTYLAGDTLKGSWPGIVYQLQHMMLTLHCALQRKDPSVLLATEMIAAKQLDDIILLYRNDKGEQVGRFVQVKYTSAHKKIHANQLLDDDGDFSLRRYFISWRKINKNKLFDRIRVKNMILCTNWDIDDLNELRENGIYSQSVEEPDKAFEIMRNPTEKLPATAWYKFSANETDNEKIYEKLKQVSDRYVLAKQLVRSLCSTNKDVRMNMPIFKKYHVALKTHVFDTSKTFLHKFKHNDNLSQEVEQFREVFLSEYRKMANDSSIDSSHGPAWYKIEEELKKLKLPKNFGLQGSPPTDSKLPVDDCVDDEEIETFLEEFTLTVNQPNANELNKIIGRELGADSRFNLLNSEFLRCAFQTKLFDWFEKQNVQGEETEYCSYEVGEKFFNDLGHEVSSLITIGVTSVYRERIKEYDVQFRSEMPLLEDFLTENESNSNSNQILELVTPKATLLTALRIYDTLERLPGYNERDSFIFTTANSLRLSILNTVMDTYGSLDDPTLLVIDCESNSAEDYSEKLWRPLCEIIAKNVKKRMIVIAQTGKDLRTQLQLKRDTYRVQEDDCSFHNLTVASQKKLLGKPVTTFQGRETEKSFGELLGICKSDNLETEESDELSEVIDSDTLLEIIRKDEIPIGEDLQRLEEIDEYYINRTIHRHIVIKKDVFDDKERRDIIAISEISGKLPGILMGMEETSPMVETIPNVITLDRNQEEKQFNALCAQNKGRNVHWLMKEPAKYIQTQSEDKYKYMWNKSSGDISYLIKYRDVGKSDDNNAMKGATHVSESDLAARDEPVIISDAAGMGKTTLLTHVANEMKKKEPDMLVIRIDLNRHCKALEKVRKQSSYDLSDIDGAVQFLAKELLTGESSLAQKVFERIIRSKRKVALMFDGFDEISPTHEDTVIILLQTLAKYGIKKLFVASRPHTRQALESKLNTFSYEIHPLSADDQENFLTRYWTARFGSHCNSERIKIYAKATRKNLSDSLEDHRNNFMSNALQTRLVAEIFENDSKENRRDFDSCKEFMASDVEQPKFPEKFDIIFLYKSLVDRKFDTYFKKTSGKKETTGNEHNNIFLREMFIETHKKLAVVALFEEDKLKQLLPSRLDRTPKQTKLGIIEERTGIITAFIDGRPHFGHRTYAEYFVARFFVDLLEKGNHDESMVKIFVADILLGDNCTTMRAFLNMLLSDEHIDVLDGESWIPHLNKHRSTSLGGTIFHVAAAEGNGRILRLFLNCPGWNSGNREALLDVKDWQNWTAVQWAFRYGNLNNIKLLSEHTDLKVNSPYATTGFVPLHMSVLFGDLDLVEYLVENGAEINSQNVNGYTPLHAAAFSGKFNVVKYLFENKAQINLQDNNRSTPLHFAAEKGTFEVVEYLVENEAEINSQNDDGYTPLHAAAFHGKFNVVKYLVEKEAKINLLENNGYTPLYVAAQGGHFDVVKYLVEKGAKINLQENIGCTPLHAAAQEGHIEIVEYLVDNNAEINSHKKNYSTPLHIAAAYGKLDVVKYLVANKAEINSQNENGATPLHYAAYGGQFDVVKYLVENKAEINFQARNCCTPLHVAAQEGKFKVVEYLVEKKAEINSKDDEGWTPLHYAAQRGQFDVVKYLIEKKAKINSKNDGGWTPLHYAAWRGQFDVVKYLVENEADINSQDGNGCTPLHLGTFNGELDVVRYLVENKAGINFQSMFGCTALHLAVVAGKFNVVQYLVENGANINSKMIGGLTPLGLAVSHGNSEVITYLTLTIMIMLYREFIVRGLIL